MLLFASISAKFTAGGGGRWGEGVAELLVAPCYRSKPEITTALMGPLTCMRTLLCKIVICLKTPHLQWRQSFCLTSKYINENGNCLSSLLAEALFLVFADGRKETPAMGRKWLY